ncbi:MAG: Asp23/Gls24 family envelope stress response protein [Actinobacteria bacterium]|nr:Asp23/Gls24 family envelope stress response protein [Actinomycetota bacterium]
MAIEGVDEAYLLPCGQDAAILWEHVTVGQLDEHELDCPHCQAASAGFVALREATGELAEAELAPPRDLTERIMRAVRTERRRDAFIPIADNDLGPIRVAAQAAAVVVRFAADQTDGVTARSCTVQQLPGEPDGWCAVRLEVALRYGVDGMAAVDRIRELVGAAARELAGFEPAWIDVTVVDIWPGGRGA